MKIEISEAFPEHFRPAYPEEFELFSHFETTAGIPSPLFAITTWKENGLPNVCFHAWSCFHGDRTAFFAVMGNLYQHTHTYANILREKWLRPEISCPSPAMTGWWRPSAETAMDETSLRRAALRWRRRGPFMRPLIAEAFLSLECTLTEAKDLTGAGQTAMVTGQVRHAWVEEAYARGCMTGATARTASCCWCPRRRTCSRGAPGQSGNCDGEHRTAGLKRAHRGHPVYGGDGNASRNGAVSVHLQDGRHGLPGHRHGGGARRKAPARGAQARAARSTRPSVTRRTGISAGGAIRPRAWEPWRVYPPNG